MVRTTSGSRRLLKWVGNGLLVVLLVWTLLPFYWMIATSLKADREIYGFEATLVPQEAVQNVGDSNVVANVPGAVAVFDSSAAIGPRTRVTLMGRFTVAVAGSLVVRLAVANGSFGHIFKLMGTGALRTTLAHLGAP